MKGFIDFIREQGVVGLAVGFILGGAVSKVVTSIVTDLVNPILGVAMGATGNIKNSYIALGPAKIMWGNFVSTLIDFIIVALVVYFAVKALGLNKLDKSKS